MSVFGFPITRFGTYRRSGSAQAICDQVINSLSNFAVVFVGLWLPLSEYGALAAAVVCYAIVIGIVRAFVIEPATARHRLDALGARILVVPLAIAVACSALLLVFALTATGAPRSIALLLAAGLPFLVAQDIGRYVAFERGEHPKAIASDVTWLVAFAALATGTFTLGGGATELLFGSWLLAGGLAALTLAPSLARKHSDAAPVVTRFNVGYGVDYVAGPLLMQVVQLTLAVVVPLAAYGQLRGATTAMAPVTVFFTATTSTLLASAARRALDSPRALSAWIARVRVGLLAIVSTYTFAALALVATLPQVPDALQGSLHLLVPIAVGNLILALDTPRVLQMKAAHQQGLLARARTLQAGIAILAPFVAIRWGILGAAWTLTAAQALGYMARMKMTETALREARQSREPRAPDPRQHTSHGGGAIDVLWVTPTPTGRALTGRETYSAGLIAEARAMRDLNVVVHAALDDRSELMSASVKARSLLSILPAMCAASRLRANRSRLRRILFSRSWDVVVVDHLQLAWVVRLARKRGIPVVYLSHNHEASTKASISGAASWPLRVLHALDLMKVRRLEHEATRGANVTNAITRADAVRFEADGATAVRVLPPVATRPLAPLGRPQQRPGPAILHFGSFIWSAKRRNLADLVACAPVFAGHGMRLVIAGSGDPVALFGSSTPPQGVDFVGVVDEAHLDDLFASCRAAIVVEPRGGGFKMKVLDLIAARLPLYVLEGSVEGLDLRDDVNCRMRSSLDALVAACVAEIDDCELHERLQRAAITELRRFAPKVVRRELRATLEVARRGVVACD